MDAPTPAPQPLQQPALQRVDPRPPRLKATIEEVLARSWLLHTEVEAYVRAVHSHSLNRHQNPVEYRNLRSDVKNEAAFLAQLADATLSVEKTHQYLESSNLVYYEALWDASKRSAGLVSFRKYFFWNRAEQGLHAPYQGLSLGKGSKVRGKDAALVDIVANKGLEWIRVSTMSIKKLEYELVKLGWRDSESDDADQVARDCQGEGIASLARSGDDIEMRDADCNAELQAGALDVSLVKQARNLARAAQANPVCGRRPLIRIVLTRLPAGRWPDIDDVLQQLRATGAVVQCANELAPAGPLSAVLPGLLVHQPAILSATVNLDCTVLLALVSDISHADCAVLDWYPGEVKAQIREEAESHLLPTQLYPAIAAHPMVCTTAAVQQMALIVGALATPSEAERADVLLGRGAFAASSPADLRLAWGARSRHGVPDAFPLPVREVAGTVDRARLPAVAGAVEQELSAHNAAIFFYGWAHGLTTLSSNRACARQMESIISRGRLEDGEAGPHVWLCSESRSLIAKARRRK